MPAELPDVALDDFGWKAKAARDACWAKCNTALAFELLAFKLVCLSELFENFSVITL